MNIQVHPLLSGRISIHLSSKIEEGEDINKSACQLLSKNETPADN